MRAQTPPSGPRPLGELLGELRREWKRAERARQGLDLPAALAGVLGEARAREVGFGGISRGTLTLLAPSAPFKAEIESFYAARLLEALRATPEGGRISRIRVAVGEARRG